MTAGYMLDTVVFNRVVEGVLDAASLAGRGPLYTTHIQTGELAACREPKRSSLLSVFLQIRPTMIPTVSAVWGVSEWGECEYGRSDGLFETMLATLDRLNGGRSNNSKDILIAKTAYRHAHTLVTEDEALLEVFRQFGGQTLRLAEFLALPIKRWR